MSTQIRSRSKVSATSTSTRALMWSNSAAARGSRAIRVAAPLQRCIPNVLGVSSSYNDVYTSFRCLIVSSEIMIQRIVKIIFDIARRDKA